jgi:hypothetical protein|tara:strand:- start:210 stop:551 length:342 start_codon:yes stop_codon:yes gene_type:complete
MVMEYIFRREPEDFLPPTDQEIDMMEALLDKAIEAQAKKEGIKIPGNNPYKPNSNHHRLFEMVEYGATLQEIVEEFKTNENNARTYISNLRRDLKSWAEIKLNDGEYKLYIFN